MGCRHMFVETFDDYGIRDPKWDGDVKYYIVRQCLGFALDMDDEELSENISPDTDFVTKYSKKMKTKVWNWKSNAWINFMLYLEIQFELPEIRISLFGTLFFKNENFLNKEAPIEYRYSYYREMPYYSIRTLRQATEFVLKYYSETDQYLIDLKLENPPLGKYKEAEVKGRRDAYRLNRAREAKFNQLLEKPIYRFFHELELQVHPRKEARPEVLNFDYTDFAGCFKPYQVNYLKYYHVYLKYRWQIRKAYNIRKAKYIGYELVRRSIEYRQRYLRSSWHRTYRSYHDYDAWYAYLIKIADEYDAEYKRIEERRRERRKKKPHFRRKGVKDRFLPKFLRNPNAFYRGSYLRRKEYRGTSMGYRFFDPPKKKYYEYP